MIPDTATLHAFFVDVPPLAAVFDCVPLTLELRDDAGVPVASGADVSGALTSDVAEVTFFEDPACTLPTGSLTVLSGATRAAAFAQASVPAAANLGWFTSEEISPANELYVFADADGGGVPGTGGGSGTGTGGGTSGTGGPGPEPSSGATTSGWAAARPRGRPSFCSSG